ncbi:helix-turn-helix transcriptional regulator [Heyndrickxia sp. NPDC080065]|uniref:helix-turn-helix transcriptional regulator n=1 Tax=Heyndrickxia sp. NPDC080065 TaxID=3390568 RepID=UPI003D00A1F4
MIRTKFSQIFNKQAATKDDWLEIDFSSWIPNHRQNDMVAVLRDCIRTSSLLEISYINMQGEVKIRTVEPIKVVFKTREWYLYAYCQLQEDYRWFRMSRILEFKSLFENSINNHSYHSTTQADNEINNDLKTHIELLFPLKVAHLVYDMFDHRCVFREETDTVRVSTDWFLDEWTYRLLLSFGENITVLKPAVLRNELKERHIKASLNLD